MIDDKLARLNARIDALERAAHYSAPGLVFVEVDGGFQSVKSGRLYSWREVSLLIDRRWRLVVLPAGSVEVENKNDRSMT